MTPRLYKRQQFKTRSEWLDARGFGGSSASAILGKNPWMSKIDLYNACVSGRKRDDEETNDAMQYGTECEKYIRSIVRLNFAGKYKVRSPRGLEMYRRVDKPYLTATLDGILTDCQTGERGVLEIKTHDIRNAADEANWSGHLPDNYFIQVVHYLAVLNDFNFAMLVAKLRYFDYSKEGGRTLKKEEIRYYVMRKSDPTIARNVEYVEKTETAFWEDNVSKRQMPDIEIG